LKPPYEYGDGIVWCGNFYSGTFVKGTGYRSLCMNYFTLLNDDYRRQGLGRLVLQHCLYEAQQRGAKHAALLTDADNFVAQNLYQSEGFEIVDATHSFVLKTSRQQ
jgi:GNAT superfamily N-acetyltransferase